jgi:hypothetical protein
LLSNASATLQFIHVCRLPLLILLPDITQEHSSSATSIPQLLSQKTKDLIQVLYWQRPNADKTRAFQENRDESEVWLVAESTKRAHFPTFEGCSPNTRGSKLSMNVRGNWNGWKLQNPAHQMRGGRNLRRHHHAPPLFFSGSTTLENSPMFISLPTLQGQKSLGYVREHLPNLFEQMRRTGNVVVDPFWQFQNSINSPLDVWAYEAASLWVFQRLPQYARSQPIYFPTFPPHDIFDDLRRDASDKYTAGIPPWQEIVLLLEAFAAVGELIRPDRGGFGCGPHIFDEFLQVGKEIMSLVADMVAIGYLFDVIEIVYRVSSRDDRILQQLIQSLCFAHRQNLINYAQNANSPNLMLCTEIDRLYQMRLIP